jgi:hypothetical protein
MGERQDRCQQAVMSLSQIRGDDAAKAMDYFGGK